MSDTIIQTKVDEFTAEELAFTSVDVCNSIKTDGTWIRNRDVAAWLRRWTPPVGYGISRVTVTLEGGGSAQASVYLPNTSSVVEYVKTSQRAMTPAEFEQIHGYDPVSASTAPPASIIDDGSDGDDGSHDASVGDRLRSLFSWPGSTS